MTHRTWPILDQYDTDGSVGVGAAESWSNGDVASRGIWMDGLNNAFSDIQYALNALANGELLIGHAADGTYKKAQLGVSNGITKTAGAGTLSITNSWTGDVTISAGVTAIGAAKVLTTMLSNAARAQYLTAIAELDLNAASATIPIGLITQAATITAINYVYTVASGAGTGVTVEVGKQGSAAFFATSTSAASQAQYTVVSQTVLNSGAVAANDFLTCDTTGTVATTGGKILVCIELMTN